MQINKKLLKCCSMSSHLTLQTFYIHSNKFLLQVSAILLSYFSTCIFERPPNHIYCILAWYMTYVSAGVTSPDWSGASSSDSS